MRRFRGVLVGLFTLGLVSALVVPALSGHARVTRPDEGGEGPYPEGLYLQMREEQIAKYRGLPWHTTYNARGRAYNRYRAQRSEVRRSAASSPFTSAVDPAWTELGPAPIPVGSPNNGPDTGRVTAIVVDPTNPDIVYVGAAQGGVWRTMDGGARGRR